jgi:hypothetical protein
VSESFQRRNWKWCHAVCGAVSYRRVGGSVGSLEALLLFVLGFLFYGSSFLNFVAVFSSLREREGKRQRTILLGNEKLVEWSGMNCRQAPANQRSGLLILDLYGVKYVIYQLLILYIYHITINCLKTAISLEKKKKKKKNHIRYEYLPLGHLLRAFTIKELNVIFI